MVRICQPAADLRRPIGRPTKEEAEPVKEGLPEICKKTMLFHGVLPVVNFLVHVKEKLR